MISGRNASRAILPAIGLVATAIVALSALGLPLHDRLELMTLDFRMRLAAPPAASPDIVHVDIDDESIVRLGRWPWDRDVHARFLDAATLLGAGRVVIDVEFSEGQRPFLPKEGADRMAEVAEEHAKRHSGVLRGVAREPSGPSAPTKLEVLAASEDKFPEEFRKLLGDEVYDFDASFVGAIERNGRVIVGFGDAEPNDKPGATPKSLVDRASIGPSVPSAREAKEIVAPLEGIVGAAAGFGTTPIGADPDGVTRRAPMLTNCQGRLYPYLGLRAALDRLGVAPADVRIEAGMIRAGSVEIPIDARGRMLLHWHRGEASKRIWTAMFEHLPYHMIHRFSGNRKTLDQHWAELTKLWPGKVIFSKRRELREATREMLAKAGSMDREKRGPELEKSVRELHVEEGQLAEILGRQVSEQERSGPTDKERARLKRVREVLIQIDELLKDTAAIEPRLRSMVGGKTLFVGAAYLGATDFHATSLDPREKIPGVSIPSNVYNMIVTGRFLSPSSAGLAAALAILFGVASMALAWRFNALVGTLSLAGILLAWAGFCQWMFGSAKVLPFVGPGAGLVLPFVSMTVYRSFMEEKKKKEIRSIFEHYMDPIIVATLVENPELAGLNGQEREGTVLFADVSGYTKYIFAATPEESLNFVNLYLSMASDLILENHGYLDKYMGDGVMAIFGAPLHASTNAAEACLTALGIQEGIEPLTRETMKKIGIPATIRVGMATGKFVVGNVGSKDRVSYTAVGDIVNLSARLQTASKDLGTRVLINEEGAKAAGDRVETRDLGYFLVRGREAPVRIHEVLSRKGELSMQKRELATWFGNGVKAFWGRDWAKAADAFRQAQNIMKDDGPTKLYLRRMELHGYECPEQLDPIPLG